MKKTIFICTAIALLLALTACGGGVATPQQSQEEDDIIEAEIVINDVSPTGLSYTLINKTDNELHYGMDYDLFVKQDDEWVRVELIQTIITPSIGLIIPPNSVKEETVGWEFGYGELPAGEYKFQKGISFDGDPGERAVICEFEIS